MRLVIIAVLVLNMAGCSIYKAATAPPPVPVDRVTVGTSRAEVMSVFGSPKNTDSAISGKTDIYESMGTTAPRN
jgi:outer membrane protein assembly factor BamE (lipoprotein component of BamABCDE complex)